MTGEDGLQPGIDCIMTGEDWLYSLVLVVSRLVRIGSVACWYWLYHDWLGLAL